MEIRISLTLVLAVLITVTCELVSGLNCSLSEFQCGDGTCIPKRRFCDDTYDCDDLSDEIVYDPSKYTTEDGVQCAKDYPQTYIYNFCLLPKNQSHKADTICRNISTCLDNEFECSEVKRCLPSLFFCNSRNNCLLDDVSDELVYNESLHTSADGIKCHDKSFTKACLLPIDQINKAEYLCRQNDTCLRNEFFCYIDNKCISKNRFCSGSNYCSDGSDEVFYDPTLHTPEDGIPCARDYRSEYVYNICLLPKNQTHKADKLCRKHSDCFDNEFSCANRKTCIPMGSFCSADNNCGDGSDDILYSLHKQKLYGGMPCYNPFRDRTCLLPSRLICDGAVHCYDNSDECNCASSKLYCNGTSECPLGIDECFCVGNNTRDNSTNFDNKCFRCLDGNKIISLAQLCDGTFHCNDLSDECLCTTSNQGTNDQSTIQAICDATICSGDDCKCSLMCRSTRNPNASNDVCLTKQHICNGRYECSDGLDERLCEKIPNQACTDDENSGDESAVRCDMSCSWPNRKRTKKCDGRPQCGELDQDECSEEACGNKTLPEFCKFVEEGTFYCKNGDTIYAGFEVCDGKPACNPSVPWESEDEIFCPDQFYCSNHEPWRIPIAKKCDLIKDCSDSSDEVNCSEKTHFYCNDGGGTKYIKRTEVCDGSEDCESATDECQDCTQGVFSSDKAMISTKPLIPFLWIISITATVGNAFTISLTLRKILRKKKSKGQKTSQVEKSQNYMIFSLSIADMLVSIYTASIVIENAILSKDGRYCLRDQEWRSGTTCSGIGAIMMIGSEASVFTLTVITTFRLRGIMKPFEKPSMFMLCFCLCMSWTLAILLATLPLSSSIEDYFIESKWYGNNPFVSKIEREYVESFTRKLLILKDKNTSYIDEHGSIGSWKLVEALLKELNPTLIPDRKFGYYSTHGVCLPRIFPNYEDATWAYSLIIILINFGAFIYILCGYATIFKLATQVTVQKSANPNRDVKLQRKVTAIVVTDFCCWVPVAIMGFLQISGVNIPNEVYVPVGTILIPINSALNPFLYSDAPEWIWKKLLPVRKWISGRFTRCNQMIERGSEQDESSTASNRLMRLSDMKESSCQESTATHTTRLSSAGMSSDT